MTDEKSTDVESGQGPSVERRVLRRSTADKMIAGVAGGLGRYLGIDPVLLRIAFVLLAVFGGSGVLLYLVGWIAVPEEKADDPVGGPPESGEGLGRTVVGLGLVVIGAWLLMGRLIPGLDRFIGPLVLIGLGAALLLGRRR